MMKHDIEGWQQALLMLVLILSSTAISFGATWLGAFICGYVR